MSAEQVHAKQIDLWMRPQARFDVLRERAQRTAGGKLCDLAYANSYDRPPTEVREALHDAINRDRALSLQYSPYGGSTISRRHVAQALRRSHDLPFRWRDIVLTPGAMAGLNMLFRSLVTQDAEGDEVIVVTPCWLDYPLYLANLGLTPRLVPLDRARFDLDLDAIGEALGPQTRALILSQPSNPTGRLYSGEQLRELSRLLEAQSEPPMLISDECHRDVVFDRSAFLSPAAFYDNTCLVYSFGKSLEIQGQRTGYIAVSPRLRDGNMLSTAPLSVRLEGLARVMGFCTPTALMQSAIGALLRIERDWTHITARRAVLESALAEAGIESIAPDATFFVYVRTGGRDDFEVTEALAEQGVLVSPSSLFHDTGHLRVSLTCSDEMLRNAIPILCSVLADAQRSSAVSRHTRVGGAVLR